MRNELNPVQLINDLIQKKLNENIFDCTPETSDFLNQNVGVVLDNFSLKQMGATIDDYESLVSKMNSCDAKFTLMEASKIINGVEQISPAMLGCGPDHLVGKLKQCNSAAVEWNAIVEPMKRSAEREINAKIEKKIIKPNNGIRPGTGNLKLN